MRSESSNPRIDWLGRVRVTFNSPVVPFQLLASTEAEKFLASESATAEARRSRSKPALPPFQSAAAMRTPRSVE